MREAERGFIDVLKEREVRYPVSQLSEERYLEFMEGVVANPELHEVIDDPERLKRELFMELTDKDQIFVAEDQNRIVGGLIGTPRGKIMQISTGFVDAQYRGKGIINELNEHVMARGKELGCTYARKEINCYNIPSIVTNMNNGYVICGCIGNIYVLFRSIGETDQEDLFLLDEMIEIPLTNKEAIVSSIRQGYAGVDIKNVYEENGEQKVTEKTDEDPAHWTMIMRKINPEALPFGRN